jgi:hypothetical protein
MALVLVLDAPRLPGVCARLVPDAVQPVWLQDAALRDAAQRSAV